MFFSSTMNFPKRGADAVGAGTMTVGVSGTAAAGDAAEAGTDGECVTTLDGELDKGAVCRAFGFPLDEA